ncbi:BQ5605_C006g03943 [Microbotryum silenes-dioicae]|uniref:BQ5605_C006g03943 protein n=1 Tax=Microbotryum silenes-dioicae TaxID=796604 RepID=A0A2X0M9N3_9BASI|nr:BQ5605_C006g03943 [Microbotryum silenes-dioicae]
MPNRAASGPQAAEVLSCDQRSLVIREAARAGSFRGGCKAGRRCSGLPGGEVARRADALWRAAAA